MLVSPRTYYIFENGNLRFCHLLDEKADLLQRIVRCLGCWATTRFGALLWIVRFRVFGRKYGSGPTLNPKPPIMFGGPHGAPKTRKGSPTALQDSRMELGTFARRKNPEKITALGST